jgi:hypothetical protein
MACWRRCIRPSAPAVDLRCPASEASTWIRDERAGPSSSTLVRSCAPSSAGPPLSAAPCSTWPAPDVYTHVGENAQNTKYAGGFVVSKVSSSIMRAIVRQAGLTVGELNTLR